MREKIKAMDDAHTQVTLVVSDELLAKLKRVQELASHRLKDHTLVAAIDYLADQGLRNLDPLEKQKRRLARDKRKETKKETEPTKSTSPSTQTPASPQTAKKEHVTQQESRPTCFKQEALHNFEEKPTALRRRPIQARLSDQVWARDAGACQYVDPVTGKKCLSRWFVQLDHVTPVHRGGENSFENLRCYCGVHNRARNG